MPTHREVVERLVAEVDRLTALLAQHVWAYSREGDGIPPDDANGGDDGG